MRERAEVFRNVLNLSICLIVLLNKIVVPDEVSSHTEAETLGTLTEGKGRLRGESGAGTSCEIPTRKHSF